MLPPNSGTPAVWFRKYYADDVIPVLTGILTTCFVSVFKSAALLIPYSFVWDVEFPLKKVNWMDFKLSSS